MNTKLQADTDIEFGELTDASQYLTFILSGEEFAVPIMKVKEIIEYRDMTNVPMVPDFIKGAINLRGGVLPVFNLAIKFGMPPSEITRRTCIVIMEVDLNDDSPQTLMGIMVDKVLQVMDIPDGDIDPPPTFGASIRTDFINGMGKLEDQFVIILDVNRVLSSVEISAVSVLKEEGPENGRNSENQAVMSEEGSDFEQPDIA